MLHVYIHQPWEDRVPGINAWFGTEFNRHNTWFAHARPWIDYLRRSHFLLQQGQHVADVAYFIGEDAPKMTGTRKPELPPGYSFDYINAEVIEQRMQVKDGRSCCRTACPIACWCCPIWRPCARRVLRKLRDLVAAGRRCSGPPPSRSPSLQNYPACDREVKKAGRRDLGKTAMVAGAPASSFGKGRVFQGEDLQSVLTRLRCGRAISTVWSARLSPGPTARRPRAKSTTSPIKPKRRWRGL